MRSRTVQDKRSPHPRHHHQTQPEGRRRERSTMTIFEEAHKSLVPAHGHHAVPTLLERAGSFCARLLGRAPDAPSSTTWRVEVDHEVETGGTDVEGAERVLDAVRGELDAQVAMALIAIGRPGLVARVETGSSPVGAPTPAQGPRAFAALALDLAGDREAAQLLDELQEHFCDCTRIRLSPLEQ